MDIKDIQNLIKFVSKAEVPQLAKDATSGEMHLYHRAHWSDGKLYYRGKVVMEKAVETTEEN